MKRVRYCVARPTLLSPWYQMTPANGDGGDDDADGGDDSPARGATIPFQSTVALWGSSAPRTTGRDAQSALMGGNRRSILYCQVPASGRGASAPAFAPMLSASGAIGLTESWAAVPAKPPEP